MEFWKTINNYPFYQVSNLGRVKSLSRKVSSGKNSYRFTKERILKSTSNGTGYLIVGLCHKSKRVNYLVHRLVAQSFLEKPKGKNVVNHLNGDKKDNRACNLEWCTQQENINHSIENKLVDQYGEKHHSSFLTESEVENIRDRYYFGKETTRAISDSLDMNYFLCRTLITGKTWCKSFENYAAKKLNHESIH